MDEEKKQREVVFGGGRGQNKNQPQSKEKISPVRSGGSTAGGDAGIDAQKGVAGEGKGKDIGPKGWGRGDAH